MAVVMAAGGGKRMKSGVPKVLHRAAGLPLLAHVLSALAPLDLDRHIVVTSPRRDVIEQGISGLGFDRIEFAVQETPRGTADALRCALEIAGEPSGSLLVVNGSTPLIRSQTLQGLLAAHEGAGVAATVLTARLPEPSVYGRVVRGPAGDVQRIVEQRDASPEELEVGEVNAGVYAFDASRLAQIIGKVDQENSQDEYYITDLIGLLKADGEDVQAYGVTADEVLGVKSRVHLAHATNVLRHRTCEWLMTEGVTIVDPATTYIDVSVTVEREAVIQPFSFLEGTTTVAAGAEVGPQARVIDSVIQAGAQVSFAVVVESFIGPNASVGPFASLRPGTRLERNAKVGTFVEAKNTTVGEDSKIPHLSYFGDATLGRGVNVGAGTITCNWDGENKYPTVIEDEAYVGSDTMLVAPLRIGRRAATGAGSVVRDDVPDDALAVGAPARMIEGRGNKMARPNDSPDKDPQEDEQQAQ